MYTENQHISNLGLDAASFLCIATFDTFQNFWTQSILFIHKTNKKPLTLQFLLPLFGQALFMSDFSLA
jgi:hypothetical protein